MIYSCNGILFFNKWRSNTCYNMETPWEHYVKWKKPVTKDHILYDSIYMKYPKIGKSIETERLMVAQGWRWMKGLGVMTRGTGFLCGVMTCSKIYCGDGFIVLFEYTKIHWIIYFEWMNYTVCELYLKKSVKNRTNTQTSLNKRSQYVTKYFIHEETQRS